MKEVLYKPLSRILIGSLLVLAAIFLSLDIKGSQNQLFQDLRYTAENLILAWEDGVSLNLSAKAWLQSSGKKYLQADIIAISSSGEVYYPPIFESNPRNLLVKEEFREAIAEGEGEALRHENNHFQRAHVALYSPDNSAVVRVSADWEYPFIRCAYVLLPFILLAISCCCALNRVLTRRTEQYSSVLAELEKRLKMLEEGDYQVRILEVCGSGYSELISLCSQFNDSAAALENKYEADKARMARLSTILNTMIDPLLMVNTDKNLLYVNHKAREVFGRELDPEIQSYPQVLLTHSEELDWLIEESMSSASDIDTHITLQTSKGKTRYQALISPIFMGENPYGVVIALHDLTIEEEVAAFRRDFIANVTHELKTPLTSIRGFVETLSNKDIPPEQIQRFLDIISVEAERLEHLIDDILSLSETERGRIKGVSSFDLSELIDEVIVLLDEQASEKRISVYTEDSLPPVLEVKAERDRLKQVLINLVDNAVKYSQEGGKVAVSAYRLSDTLVQITVEDDGPGISKEAQKRIFERFFRVDTGRSRSLGGTGLGLSIVKHIAQLYGGTAEVESVPGEGSRFVITMKI